MCPSMQYWGCFAAAPWLGKVSAHLGDVLRLSRGLLIAQSQPPHHRCDCYEDPLPERCVSKICMSMYRSVCVGQVDLECEGFFSIMHVDMVMISREISGTNPR